MQYEMPVQPVVNQDMFGGNNGLWFLFLLLSGRGNLLGNQATDQLDFSEVKSALQNIGNGICSSSFESAKSFADLSSSLQACCCDTRQTILQTSNDTNRNIDQARYDSARGMDALGHSFNDSFNHLTRDIDRGFDQTRADITQVRFEGERQTCEVIRNNDRNTQVILDKMSSAEADELRRQLSDTKSAYDNLKQTATIIEALKHGNH